MANAGAAVMEYQKVAVKKYISGKTVCVAHSVCNRYPRLTQPETAENRYWKKFKVCI